MYYCSDFAPFTGFQKMHIEALMQKKPTLTLVFVNETFTALETKLYFSQIFQDLGVELPYIQLDIPAFNTFLSNERAVFCDQLLKERVAPAVAENTTLQWMLRAAVFGYETKPFATTFVFDDVSEKIAAYIIKHEYFNTNKHIGLVFNNMSYRRFQHTMRVCYQMRHLAAKHQIDNEIAQFTALFHDYAKENPIEEQKAIMEQYFPAYTDSPKAVWHGFAATIALEHMFGKAAIDEDVYEAISFHPIGVPHLSELGLALFIADYCDYRRPFLDEVVDVWEMAQTDLYQAAEMKIDHLQKYFAETGKTLYWTTENMLKWLKERKQ